MKLARWSMPACRHDINRMAANFDTDRDILRPRTKSIVTQPGEERIVDLREAVRHLARKRNEDIDVGAATNGRPFAKEPLGSMLTRYWPAHRSSEGRKAV